MALDRAAGREDAEREGVDLVRGLRIALILVLIALRPGLLLLLWPIVAIARFLSAIGAVSFVFGVYLVLHTADPRMTSLGWLWIAFLPAFSLLATVLKALQRSLREDPTLRFGSRRSVMSQPGSMAGLGSRPTRHA
jgi:hypothetical protein